MWKIPSRNNQGEKLLLKKYKQYRKLSRELAEKILERYTDEKSLKTVSQLMGIREGSTLVLESEDEVFFLMDFSLFEYLVEGKNFIQRYLEEQAEISETERSLLQAKLSNYTSLFEIVEANGKTARVKLKNLLESSSEITIMDINLSRTARPGLLMFTRIVPYPDFNMTSGMFCLFEAGTAKTLLKRFKVMKKRVKSDSESIQRFIAFFKLNRTEGLATGTIDTTV
jgi:tRNA threonylcarbamoyladenosine modification (KEOPS) complex Cgi121 subunit